MEHFFHIFANFAIILTPLKNYIFGFSKKSAPNQFGQGLHFNPNILTQKWPKKSAPKQSGHGLNPPPSSGQCPDLSCFFSLGLPLPPKDIKTKGGWGEGEEGMENVQSSLIRSFPWQVSVSDSQGTLGNIFSKYSEEYLGRNTGFKKSTSKCP